MSHAEALEAETMADAFQSGYSRGQIVKSVALALVLHAAIVGGLLALGSEKKPHGKAAATKSDASNEKDGAAKSGDPKSGAAGSAKGDDLTKSAPATTVKDEAAKKESAKNVDTAKPNEIPSAPDADIENILKAK